MADDRRFMVGWGAVIAAFACVGLVSWQWGMTLAASAGVFLAIVGIVLAVLSAWGPREPLLAGVGTAALVLGTAMATVAYGFDIVLVFFVVILIAGLALVAVGLRKR